MTATAETGGAGTGHGDATVADLLLLLARRWRILLAGPLAAGAVAFGATYLVPQTFTASTSFLVPQSQGGAAALIASLGSLAALADGGAGRTTGDQFASLLQSTTVADRLIDRFKLTEVYDVKLRADARLRLEENTRVITGRRGGMIVLEVDDHDPKRSADIANQYIEELRGVSARLALSEAQQRRVFFEGLLKKTRDDLVKAQMALQGSGFNQGVLRAEPRAAADSYARTRAEVSAAEVRLQTLQRSLTDSTPEVERAKAQLDALRGQLARVERADQSAAKPDYLMHYREFKYQETLFELFSRQYELARVDEAREGTLIQVVDVATTPERKSKPRRAVIAVIAALAAFFVLAGGIVLRDRLRPAAPRPA